MAGGAGLKVKITITIMKTIYSIAWLLAFSVRRIIDITNFYGLWADVDSMP